MGISYGEGGAGKQDFTKDLTLHDEGPYDVETSPLICSPSQWTGFYMTRTSVMKE